MGKKINIGVVGVGNMGLNHVRVYTSLKQVEKVYLFDADIEKARQIAAQYECEAVESEDFLRENVDAVSICVPTSHHVQTTIPYLESGIDCLIEKPLSDTVEGAQKLMEAADKGNAQIMVGHIERFNPAVLALREVLKGHTVLAIEAQRLSYVSSRITDVNVVMDLMVHDLDIVRSIHDKDCHVVAAKTVSVPGQDFGGYASTILEFSDGVIANVTASRITPNKVRTLAVTTDKGHILVDYIQQGLIIYKGQGPAPINHDTGNFSLDLSMERVMVRNREPLRLELESFVHAIMNDEPVEISAKDAMKTMDLVWKVQEKLG